MNTGKRTFVVTLIVAECVEDGQRKEHVHAVQVSLDLGELSLALNGIVRNTLQDMELPPQARRAPGWGMV